MSERRTSLKLEHQAPSATSGPPKTIDAVEPIALVAVHGYDHKGQEIKRLGYFLGEYFYISGDLKGKKPVTFTVATTWVADEVRKALHRRKIIEESAKQKEVQSALPISLENKGRSLADIKKTQKENDESTEN